MIEAEERSNKGKKIHDVKRIMEMIDV